MTMIGADPDELDRLAATFDHAAEQTRRIEWLASSRLFLAGWHGPDIDDIRFRWHHGARPGLRHCTQSLTQAARQVRDQADQQRRASDAGLFYARSSTWSPGLGDLLGQAWRDAVGTGRSLLDAIGSATGDLFVSLATLVPVGAAAVGEALDDLGRQSAKTAGDIVDDVIKPWLDREILQNYDLLAGLPGIGELVEQTAGVVPAASLLDGTGRQLDVTTVYDNLATNYGGPGHIEVQTVRGADGQDRYVVYIPGTQEWVPGSNNPADVMSDLEVGGFYDDTPLSIAVEKAMGAAGIPPGAPVVLAGHSLGGLTAVQLSRDSDFAARYDVQGVFTAGAGTDLTPPPDGVQFQALRHYNDVVSWLGNSEPLRTGAPGQQEHWSWGPSPINPLDNHNMPGYQDDAQRLQDAGAFTGTQQALPGFFGPGSAVVDSQGFQARKLTYLGDAPALSAEPVAP